jgi:hypothetical protein
MQSVFVEANDRLYGSVVDVHIADAFPNSLTGTPVTGSVVFEDKPRGQEAFA